MLFHKQPPARTLPALFSEKRKYGSFLCFKNYSSKHGKEQAESQAVIDFLTGKSYNRGRGLLLLTHIVEQ
jgi:hypothetical protein